MRQLAVALALLALTACAPRPTPQTQCLSYGYKPGTEAMAQCVMFVSEASHNRAAAWWVGQMGQWR